jgi:hypothetical protein
MAEVGVMNGSPTGGIAEAKRERVLIHGIPLLTKNCIRNTVYNQAAYKQAARSGYSGGRVA